MEGNIENLNSELDIIRGKIRAIPSVDKTLTKEGAGADAKVTGEELAKKVNTTDIVDNLTSTDTDKPLSARQGKLLNDKLNELISLVTNV